jgi:UDP-N-acetyl-D-galactosamine dehydrogenase
MGVFIAGKLIKLMLLKDVMVKNASVLILGITFKENCPDIRNSRVIDIYNQLKQFQLDVSIYDPLANPHDVFSEYQIRLVDKLEKKYTAIVLAVAHTEFISINIDDLILDANKSVVYDIKSFFAKNLVDARL